MMKNTTWIINVLSFESRVTAANSFFLSNFTHLLVEKALAAVFNLPLSSRSLNITLTLLKLWKSVWKVVVMLMSTNKKVFKEEKLCVFVIYLQRSNIYLICFQPIAIYLLSIYVSLTNSKAWFFCKT